MSLTQADHVFASLHENGLNDFLTAVFTARRHYLNYGTSLFVPTSTATASHIATIPFPGIPGGIEWAVSFSIPRIDLYPQTTALPPQLTLNPGQFSVRTRARLQLGCIERGQFPGLEERTHLRAHPIAASLDVFAVGHPTVHYVTGTSGDIGLAVDAVELVDVAPDQLESLLECLILMLLQSVLANVRFSFYALRAGAFALALQRGPLIEGDQLKLYGTT